MGVDGLDLGFGRIKHDIIPLTFLLCGRQRRLRLALRAAPSSHPALAVRLPPTAISNQRDSDVGSYQRNYTLSFIPNLSTPPAEASGQNGSPSSRRAFKLKLAVSWRPPLDLDSECAAHS